MGFVADLHFSGATLFTLTLGDMNPASRLGRAEVEAKLARLRQVYEPFMSALADLLVMPLPTWVSREGGARQVGVDGLAPANHVLA